MCCNYGHQDVPPLSEREIICGNCGFQIEWDKNAAVNIMVLFLAHKEFFEKLLLEPSVTG
ncbi:MAG: zinc ribbon domain-containing protein [Candidatus Hodarchaeota archaeon]